MRTLNSQFGKVTCVLVLIVMISCLGSVSLIVAHQEKLKATQPFQHQEDPRTTAADSLKPLYAPEHPILCNDLREYVDEAILRWVKLKGTYLIVINRLGAKEKGNLSKSRVDDIEFYLKQRYNGEITYVTAQGSRVKGLGQLEFYVGGRLLAVVPVKRNDKGVCSGKVNPFR